MDNDLKRIAAEIPGYTYGTDSVPRSAFSVRDLEKLKLTAGFTAEDERYLRLAGAVLADQTEQIVAHWRAGIIAGIPHLARHSHTPEGEAIPDYLAKSNLRFQQWLLDTCLRPYDQDWMDYQQEIGLRHTSLKKNKTDEVRSTPQVPLRDVIAFAAVMNETIKPYLAAQGHSVDDVNRMHSAWCKSMQMQLALWLDPYARAGIGPESYL